MLLDGDRAAAFAAQADRSRAMTAGYIRQAMDVARQVGEIRDAISESLAAIAVPHRWNGTRLELMNPLGDWVTGPDLTGPTVKGDPGTSIVSAEMDENNHLQITLSDWSIVDAGEIVGPTGISVSNAQIVAGNLVLTFSDGEEVDLGDITGPSGRGITAANILDGNLVLTFSDATTADLGQVVGTDGEGAGDFIGPGASVTDNFVAFSSNTGKAGKDSGKNAASFATAEQGTKADTALQQAQLGATVAPVDSPAFSGNPTAPTQTAGNNSNRLATTAFVLGELAALVSGAPGLLNTFDEIANALGDDPNFATTVMTAITARLIKTNNLSDLTDANAALTNLGLSANGSAFVKAANYAAMRSLLGLVVGTDVQAYHARLASLAGLSFAAGDIIYATGSNALARLAKGTALQELRMNAGATAPEWATPSTGALVAIGSLRTGTNVAALDFTTGIDSTYEEYILKFWAATPVSLGQLQLLLSSNSGSSYDINLNYYYSAGAGNAATDLKDAASTTTGIPLTLNGVSNTANEGGVSGEIRLFRPSDAKKAHLRAETTSISNGYAEWYGIAATAVSATSAINALRLKFASGNIASIRAQLYGVKSA